MCVHIHGPIFPGYESREFFFSAVTESEKRSEFFPSGGGARCSIPFFVRERKRTQSGSIYFHKRIPAYLEIGKGRGKKEPFFVREHISQKRGGGGRCSPSAIFPTLLIVREKRRLGEGGRVKKLSRGQMGACACVLLPHPSLLFLPMLSGPFFSMKPCSDVPIRMWTVPKNPDKTPIGFLTTHFHRCLQSYRSVIMHSRKKRKTFFGTPIIKLSIQGKVHPPTHPSTHVCCFLFCRFRTRIVKARQ